MSGGLLLDFVDSPQVERRWRQRESSVTRGDNLETEGHRLNNAAELAFLFLVAIVYAHETVLPLGTFGSVASCASQRRP